MMCRCAGILLNTQVDGFVALNESQMCITGIEIYNNKSLLIGNRVMKSDEDGIAVICNSKT